MKDEPTVWDVLETVYTLAAIFVQALYAPGWLVLDKFQVLILHLFRVFASFIDPRHSARINGTLFAYDVLVLGVQYSLYQGWIDRVGLDVPEGTAFAKEDLSRRDALLRLAVLAGFVFLDLMQLFQSCFLNMQIGAPQTRTSLRNTLELITVLGMALATHLLYPLWLTLDVLKLYELHLLEILADICWNAVPRHNFMTAANLIVAIFDLGTLMFQWTVWMGWLPRDHLDPKSEGEATGATLRDDLVKFACIILLTLFTLSRLADEPEQVTTQQRQIPHPMKRVYMR